MGSENENLPGFVALCPDASERNWRSAYVWIRPRRLPIADLHNARIRAQ